MNQKLETEKLKDVSCKLTTMTDKTFNFETHENVTLFAYEWTAMYKM